MVLSVSFSHVLWDFPAYSMSRNAFLQKLQMELGDSYGSFNVLDSVEKASFILGNELWEENFASHLGLVYCRYLGGMQIKTLRQ